MSAAWMGTPLGSLVPNLQSDVPQMSASSFSLFYARTTCRGVSDVAWHRKVEVLTASKAIWHTKCAALVKQNDWMKQLASIRSETTFVEGGALHRRSSTTQVVISAWSNHNEWVKQLAKI